MTQRERQLLRWIEENPMISQQELAEKAGITRSSVAVHISNLMKKGCIAGKGYIVRSSPYVVVIGGASVDISGHSYAPLRENESNPGQIRLNLGGTGRNIAHNLSLLGIDTHLICALGDDPQANRILTSCSELGIDTSHALRLPGASTPTRLFITAPDGQQMLAVSDMDIYKMITPSLLAAHLPLLNNARLLIIDTNLPEDTITWVVENCRVPIFADPVSAAKADRLLPVLSRLHTIKPNRAEAESISGIPLTSRNNIDRAADVLLARGLKRLFITLGAEGVFAADHRERCFLPRMQGKNVNPIGCGDAFTAAIVWAHLNGTNLENTARAGLAAASIALESDDSINPALCAAQVHQRSAASRVKFEFPRK